jgi:hypothetical protein
MRAFIFGAGYSGQRIWKAAGRARHSGCTGRRATQDKFEALRADGITPFLFDGTGFRRHSGGACTKRRI